MQATNGQAVTGLHHCFTCAFTLHDTLRPHNINLYFPSYPYDRFNATTLPVKHAVRVYSSEVRNCKLHARRNSNITTTEW